MNERRARAFAGRSFAVSVTLSAGAAVFLAFTWGTPLRPTECGTKGHAIDWAVVVGGVGAVLAARRPANPIGWIPLGKKMEAQ